LAVEPGLYVKFFNEGEARQSELPPVGPLEHVVVRDGSLIADRKDGDRTEHFDGGGRWIEAEYEFQRAIGTEPGGARRSDLRIVAPQGVYLRFITFGSTAQDDPVPELGPYAVVVIGRRAVEADGDRLATRIRTKQNLWELTAVGGTALVGVIRPDIAFRTRSTRYHPEIEPFRSAHRVVAASARAAKPYPPASRPQPAAADAASAPARARPAKPHTPVPHAPSPPAPAGRVTPPPPDPGPRATPAPVSRLTDARAITLRDRIRADHSTRPDTTVASSGRGGREWAGALWQLRFAIIAALIVMIAVFSVPSIRSAVAGGSPAGSASTVAIGTTVRSPDWDYRVGSARRVARIGSSQARGIYLVVQVAATNRNGAVAQLSPSNFTLTAADGEQYAAQPTSSNVYLGELNPDSSYAWPTEFPVGRSAFVPLIFDVNAFASGTQLVILDVPSTRIRLE
jgi:hypothetical protein